VKRPQPEIAALAAMTTAELRTAWARLHGSEPPPRLNRDLMIRAIAYKAQEQAHGGLSPATRRRLRALTAAVEVKRAGVFDPGVLLKPGAKAQLKLASNAAERSAGTRRRSPSLLAGLLYDGEGHRMTPTHAVKNGTRYRYYVSRPLITRRRGEHPTVLRIPVAQIEQIVMDRIGQLLAEPGQLFEAVSSQIPDAAEQQRVVKRTAELAAASSDPGNLKLRSALVPVI